MPRMRYKAASNIGPKLKAANAEKVLRLVSGLLRSTVGEDREPSDFWIALGHMSGVDKDGLELAQDAALMCADILDAIAMYHAKPDIMAASIFAIVAQNVPEIKDDIEAIKR